MKTCFTTPPGFFTRGLFPKKRCKRNLPENTTEKGDLRKVYKRILKLIQALRYKRQCQAPSHWTTITGANRKPPCSPSQPNTKLSGCSTCRVLSPLCICNIFVRSPPPCPKWVASPWQAEAKSNSKLNENL